MFVNVIRIFYQIRLLLPRNLTLEFSLLIFWNAKKCCLGFLSYFFSTTLFNIVSRDTIFSYSSNFNKFLVNNTSLFCYKFYFKINVSWISCYLLVELIIWILSSDYFNSSAYFSHFFKYKHKHSYPFTHTHSLPLSSSSVSLTLLLRSWSPGLEKK